MRALVFSLLLLFSTSVALAAAPDAIFVHGNIYTGSAARPRVEAIAVEDGRITFAGSTADARKRADQQTGVIDLHGQTVLPGLTDSHCHIFGIGEREMTLNLEGTKTREDFLEKVKERVAGTEPGKWITGRGWIETFWKPPEFPTAADLDKVAPDNPIFLTRADGHAAVANSAALRMAGVSAGTADPFGGRILKDKTTGAPTGMMIDNARDLIAQHIPPPTAAEREAALLRGIKRSIELGWCEIQNAGGSTAEAELIRRVSGEGKSKLRIYNAVYGPGEAADRLLREGAVVGERFTQRTIKVVADGALGSRGAALLEPYADGETSGFLTVKEEELQPMLEKALRQGIQVETHAIGDRANRFTLDQYEAAFAAVPAPDRKIREPRWRIEHAQVVSAADLPRFARLGVIPSMQPSHAISDLFFAPSRLGLKRLAGAYAWQSLIKSGAIIPAGSDAPVERGEPMIEFYAAVTRRSQSGFTGKGWHPEEAVSRAQALKMFTAWPAFAAFQEKEKGSIEVGRLADFTVLSADIMKIPAREILQTRCTMTVIGGEIVFEAKRP